MENVYLDGVDCQDIFFIRKFLEDGSLLYWLELLHVILVLRF